MKINKSIIIFTIFIILNLNACSSVPKKTGEINKIRSQTEDGMKTANNYATNGNYEHALNLITEYKRMAILTDVPSLIIRTCLSRGNILFALERTDEAFEEWDRAIAEAEKANDIEFLSASKLYKARGSLISGRSEPKAVFDEVNRLSMNIKKDALFIGFSWQLRGLSLRAMGYYKEAEDAMNQSLAIHEKAKSLENVSFDWYTIASIRSLAGNSSGALQALAKSIETDRRIENSWGLAASWRAVGDVFTNIGRENDAMEAYNRARDIYSAMRKDHEIAEKEKN